MSAQYEDVDKLYKALKIVDVKSVRSSINSGNMGTRLNTNFSAVLGNKGQVSFSNSTGNLKL